MLKSASKTKRNQKSTPTISTTKVMLPTSSMVASSDSNPTLDYLRKQSDLLRQLRENRSKNLEDLANLLKLISDGFPESDKSIIHYQNTEEFALFSSAVVDAIASKYDAQSDRYSIYKAREKSNQCVEANILQYIAKLRIPMSETVYKRSYPTPFANIMTELLSRTAKYFNNPRSDSQMNHLTFTLAALTNIDINQFKVEQKGRGFFEKDSVSFGQIDTFVSTAIGHINHNLNKWKPDALIRALHAIIILKQSDAKFKDFLPLSLVESILKQIEDTLHPLDQRNPRDVSLAQQLFLIRNIYSDIFPDNLSSMINPFTTIFSASSHGSGFENAVFRTLRQAARDLQPTYGSLIDSRLFNPTNPISDALGLESDISYQNGFVKTCIQVDGDKYHTYNGSKNTTQKTLLRDFCFLQDGWNLINFTDATNDKESAKQFIIDKIIIPTYEAKTKYNLEQVAKLGSTKEALEVIFDHVEKAEATMVPFAKFLQQIRTNIYYDSPYQGKLSELTDHYNNLEKLITSAKNAMRTLTTLERQAQDFNISSAKELSEISVHLRAVSDEISSQTREIKSFENTNSKLSSELKEIATSLGKISEKNADIQKQIETLQAKQTLALIKRDEVNGMFQELEKYTANTDSKKVRPQGLPLRQDIKRMDEEVKNELSGYDRDISNLERQAIQEKSIACQLIESQKSLQKKQSLLRSNLSILEDALASNIEKKLRYEAILKAPVIGEKMMTGFADLQKFIAQSNVLIEALANIDSHVKAAETLYGDVEQENLEAQMSKHTLYGEYVEQSDEEGNGCVYYSTPATTAPQETKQSNGPVYYSAPQMSQEQYIAYQHYLYQQQLAYQRQMAYQQMMAQQAYWEQQKRKQPSYVPMQPQQGDYPHIDKENPEHSYYGYGAPTTSYDGYGAPTTSHGGYGDPTTSHGGYVAPTTTFTPGYQAKARSYASYTPIASTQQEPSERNKLGEKVVNKV